MNVQLIIMMKCLVKDIMPDILLVFMYGYREKMAFIVDGWLLLLLTGMKISSLLGKYFVVMMCSDGLKMGSIMNSLE